MAGLDELADELELRARRVDAMGAQLATAATEALWSSVAADAFRAQVARRRDDLGAAAAQLRVAAGGMRAFALGAANERRRLERLAAEAVSALDHLGRLIGDVA